MPAVGPAILLLGCLAALGKVQMPDDAQVRRISWVLEGLGRPGGGSCLLIAAPSRPHKKGAREGALFASVTDAAELLDLGFLELDVLSRDRVVLLHRELLGHGPRVLLRDVEIARVGGRHRDVDMVHSFASLR